MSIQGFGERIRHQVAAQHHVISLWGPGPAAKNSRAKIRLFLRSFARPYLFTQNPYKQRKTAMDDAI